MSETIDGNTIRAEEISYDFTRSKWCVRYLDKNVIRPFFTREVGPTATLQEVFNLLIQEIKKK